MCFFLAFYIDSYVLSLLSILFDIYHLQLLPTLPFACYYASKETPYIVILLLLAVYHIIFFRYLYTHGLLLQAGLFYSLLAFWRIVFYFFPLP
jgi:hypothetical protein